MRPARAYEGLAAARTRLFEWVRPLGQEQYTRAFPFGMGSIRATLLETAGAEWGYSRRLRGEIAPARDQRPTTEAKMPTFADLEPFWVEQAKATHTLLASITDWDHVIDAPARIGDKRMRVSGTLGDFATQLLFHEVHHRAQVMAMLRQLGVRAENLDYGSFMLQWREDTP